MTTTGKQTTAGLNVLRDAFRSEVTAIALGDDDTAASEADTGLGNELNNVAATSTLVGAGPGEVIHVARLTSAQGNGNTYTEAGTEDGAGTLLNRVTYPGQAKTALKELEIRVKTKIKNEVA